jgi:hypothetical protein
MGKSASLLGNLKHMDTASIARNSLCNITDDTTNVCDM